MLKLTQTKPEAPIAARQMTRATLASPKKAICRDSWRIKTRSKKKVKTITTCCFNLMEVWKREEVHQDIRGPTRHIPKLNWGHQLDGAKTELDYFLLMYPHDHLDETLAATNQQLRARKQRAITRQEWFKFIGILLATSYCRSRRRSILWEEPDHGRLAAGGFGKWMSRSRFQRILSALSFGSDDSDEETSTSATAVSSTDCSTRHTFAKVRSLIAAFNNQRLKVFVPGTHLRVDESVSEWRERDATHLEGCPHVTKIIRKPKGVGVEIKNLADSETGIVLVLEIVEEK